MPMRTFLMLLLMLLLPRFAVLAQPADTIYGKVASIREQVVFLTDSIQNLKLFSTEGDYGHSGFVSEAYTKQRFRQWWYDTHWVHYLNYYKAFAPDGRLLEEAWYYKDQSVMEGTVNEYDAQGRIIRQHLQSYQHSVASFTYDDRGNLLEKKEAGDAGNSVVQTYSYDERNALVRESYVNSEYPKEAFSINYGYDTFGNLLTVRRFNRYGADYGTTYAYDALKRKTEIYNYSPFVWVQQKKTIRQKRTKTGRNQISRVFDYDAEGRLTCTQSYNPEFNNGNIAGLYGTEINTYDGGLLKETCYYDRDNVLNCRKSYSYDAQGRKIGFSYTVPRYPESDVSIRYTYADTAFPTHMVYTEKGVATTVDFDYVFDAKGNWVSQTKSVNGQKRYRWTRVLAYFD